MLAAAVSVSLDELATGAVLGATHQSLMPTLPAIALQALAGSELGLCLGRWAGARAGRGAGLAAGLVLVATGAWLATGVFPGRPA